MPSARPFWLLILLASGLGSGAQASDPANHPPVRTNVSFIIDTWSTEAGLPQNSVIAMTQSRDGYLWLGTLDGLVRFDGVAFSVFDEGNTPQLSGGAVVKVFEDGRERLWIGMEDGGILLLRDGEIRSIELGQGGRESRLVSICEDGSGAIWLLTAGGTLARFVDEQTGDEWSIGTGREVQFRSVIAETNGLILVATDSRVATDGRVFGIDPAEVRSGDPLPQAHQEEFQSVDLLLESKRGGHWQLADGRVQRWNGAELELDLRPYVWGATNPVSVAREDLEGNLIVGTLGAGVFWFDGEGRATQISTEQGLSHDWVLSLVMDEEGSLWVGTDGGGLNRVKRQVFEVLPGTEGRVVQSVYPDGEGGLWIGSYGAGVIRWEDGVQFSGLDNYAVRSVFRDSRERVWVGTDGLGLLQWRGRAFAPDRNYGIINLRVPAIHEDASGNLWLGSQAGLIRYSGDERQVLTTADGMSVKTVTAIADDGQGGLWIGTERGGLNHFQDGRFEVYRRENSGLPSDTVYSLLRDEDGVLWVGTSGGLARFDGKQWATFGMRDGLPSNRAGYLLEDAEGFLWVGSNQGLIRLRKEELAERAGGAQGYINVRTYNTRDGLPTSECTRGSQPAGLRMADGALLFPTIRGLVRVNPADIQRNTIPPPVVIESVLIDDVPQGRGSLRAVLPASITLPAGSERLEVHYTSLNLGAPERATFRYRLEGLEEDWTRAGGDRVVRYPKLPPGDYRFRVIAGNEDGVWNETGASIGVVVLPPFWRTWWFVTLATALLLGLVVSVVHYFATQRLQRQLALLKQREELEKERSRIARDLHDQLGANLTQVSLLGELVESDKNEPAEVESHAQQISKTARETTRALDEIVWAANPENDTLDGLVNYICKYAQDYFAMAGLRYRIDAPPVLPQVIIPPDLRHNVFLTAKEAVNNIVKHAGATEARVRLKLDADRFSLEIEDNGRGLTGMDPEVARRRNGLRNMRKRMEDVRGSFEIGPGRDGGTLVRLEVPIPEY